MKKTCCACLLSVVLMTLLTILQSIAALASSGQLTYYYNPSGGKYYHSSQNCELVDSKYLPMTELSAVDLQAEPLNRLVPCEICVGVKVHEDSQSEAFSPLPLVDKSIVPVRIMEPKAGDMPVSEALGIATREIADMLNDTEDHVANMLNKANFLSLTIRGVDTPVWIVSFFSEEKPGIVSTVTIQSPSGQVLLKASDFFWEFSKTWEEWGWDNYYFWSAEEKALYHALYQPHPTRIVPEEVSISQEEALQIAMDEMKRKFELSDNELASFKIDFNYVPAWYVQQGDNSWLIIFRSAAKQNLYQVVLSASNGTVYTCDRNEAG